MDHTSLLYIRACNVGISNFLSLVFNCARVVIDLPPSWSRQVKGDGWIVYQRELAEKYLGLMQATKFSPTISARLQIEQSIHLQPYKMS